MSLSVYQVLESVENGEGRFRSLRDVVFERDRTGRPVFTVSGRMISFPVSWQDRSYVLKCLLDRNNERLAERNSVAVIVGQKIQQNSYLVDYRYLSNELLVFDDMGRSGYADVVLMEMPEGAKYLYVAFDEFCLEGNREKLRELFREFCRMAVWLIDSGLVHGALCPKNMLLLPNGALRLINYEQMRMISEESPDYEAIRDADNVMLANMVLGQKAMIAKVLAQRCPIILLDEPTAFLDVTSRIETMVLLRRLAVEQRKAILLSTHDLDLAIQLGDCLWLQAKGRPMACGTPEDLILRGAFERFFDKEGIVFDPHTGKLNVTPPTIPIGVEGDVTTAYWVGNALLRNGRKPSALSRAYTSVRCEAPDRLRIQYPNGDEEIATSIAALIERIL